MTEREKRVVKELMERWREADYHWCLEFGPVPPRADMHTPDDPLWEEALGLLAEPKEEKR